MYGAVLVADQPFCLPVCPLQVSLIPSGLGIRLHLAHTSPVAPICDHIAQRPYQAFGRTCVSSQGRLQRCWVAWVGCTMVLGGARCISTLRLCLGVTAFVWLRSMCDMDSNGSYGRINELFDITTWLGGWG